MTYNTPGDPQLTQDCINKTSNRLEKVEGRNLQLRNGGCSRQIN